MVLASMVAYIYAVTVDAAHIHMEKAHEISSFHYVVNIKNATYSAPTRIIKLLRKMCALHIYLNIKHDNDDDEKILIMSLDLLKTHLHI